MPRIPIRTKLAAALAVPLIAMGVLALIEIASVSSEAEDIRSQTRLATATIGPNGLITALQNERNWASAYLVGVDKQLTLEVKGYDKTRAATDSALQDFQASLQGRGPVARDAYAPALGGLADLATLRKDIDEYTAHSSRTLADIGFTTTLFDRYTALIAPFLDGMSRISIATDDRDLRQGANLTETVTRQIEIMPQIANALVLPATVSTGPGDASGISSSAEIAKISRLRVVFDRQAEVLRTAGGPYAAVAEKYYPQQITKVIDDQATKGVSTGNVDVQVFLNGLDVPLDQAYLGYRDHIAGALQDRADELNASAASREKRLELLVAVTFGAALVLMVLVSLSITRPLRSLTEQAKNMATRLLPDAVSRILETPMGEDVVVPELAPVRVATRDEVADVADALSTVQDSALTLAVEQAVLRRNVADSFVNLGRRNQNLLGRQLDLITRLETNETDPDALANLFRLDHLATRMRRNAESLLVLAGLGPPRNWAPIVRLPDVIRAALGEVEDFQRVSVRGVEPVTILGSAAAALAHLLAELIENALAFSPTDQVVEIHGVRHTRRSDRPGGYTLAVVDYGRGMPPAELATANRRLAGAESFTIAPSKYLGHFVTGNLAARYGIAVRLHNSLGGGTTATVELPPNLLAAPGGEVPAAPPAPASITRG
ncbi:MAG TPA: ATP-binding protein [Acidimicrobiales bacterium]|nr:ATP-binding protein [Acidimicrobiales bacterium]